MNIFPHGQTLNLYARNVREPKPMLPKQWLDMGMIQSSALFAKEQKSITTPYSRLTMKSDKYLSVSEYAEKHNVTQSRIRTLCRQGRIDGVNKIGNATWIIPENAPYPSHKSGRPGMITLEEAKAQCLKAIKWGVLWERRKDIPRLCPHTDVELSQVYERFLQFHKAMENKATANKAMRLSERL